MTPRKIAASLALSLCLFPGCDDDSGNTTSLDMTSPASPDMSANIDMHAGADLHATVDLLDNVDGGDELLPDMTQVLDMTPAVLVPHGFIAGNGDIYVADDGHARVKRISAASSTVTTVLGTGDPGSSVDGTAATSADMTGPVDVVVASNGDFYVADWDNNCIRVVKASDSKVYTVAGICGEPGTPSAGLATSSLFRYIGHMYLDETAGILYVPTFSDALVAITLNATLSLSTLEIAYTSTDQVTSVTKGSDGIIYFGTANDCHIYNLVAGIANVVVAASGTCEGSNVGVNNDALTTDIGHPAGLWGDPNGNIYIAENIGSQVRKFNIADSTLVTIAGNGTEGPTTDGAVAATEMLDQPEVVSGDAAGNIYIIEDRDLVLKVTTDGNIHILSGAYGDTSGNTEGAATADGRYDNPAGAFNNWD